MPTQPLRLGCLCVLLAAGGLALAEAPPASVHQQLLDLAARQQEQRRTRFAAVKTPAELQSLQKDLRQKLLDSMGGLPTAEGPPAVKSAGMIEADEYTIEKLVYESLPGYFVPALLYKPRKIDSPRPAILSPCGHSNVGKAAGTYQILHINLVRRGYIVLTYDPVGQGERSQFWDAQRGRSRFNLTCGEHAVLGTPLYLLGSNLARYRVWDGIRGLDYLASLPDVDKTKLGCVGNSGGGTLTAYIAALDPRVKAAAIGCYITTLPRRMATRIQADPDTDPEQDLFGAVSEGIDHAGLLALAPRPTLLATARFDFFPIEGARESLAEAKPLFAVAGAADAVDRAEAAEKHGLSKPLREAIYPFFDRHLAGRKAESAAELPVTPRSFKELLVCKDGQVNRSHGSQHLLTLALAEFDKRPESPRKSLTEVLRLDPDSAAFRLSERPASDKASGTLIVCLNGNEGRLWQEEKAFLDDLATRGHAVAIVDPRGVGALRPELTIKGHDYTDPLNGVEANIAANAFLVGKSLVGMRVTDARAAVDKLAKKKRWKRIVLVGRRDSALVACLTAAIDPAVSAVAVETMPLSLRSLFDPVGRPFNPAGIVPGMLRDFGDVREVLVALRERRALIAAGQGKIGENVPGVELIDSEFTRDPATLTGWLDR